MSQLEGALDGTVSWIEDRGRRVPQSFGDPLTELGRLEAMAAVVDLTHMAWVRVSGAERTAFLSGLITQQIRKATPERAIYAGMLTPQGRFLWDFTLVDHDEGYRLITEPDRAAQLADRLFFYLLRTKAKVEAPRPGEGLLALAGPEAATVLGGLWPALADDLLRAERGDAFTPESGMKVWRDPRHVSCGWRLLAPSSRLPTLWNALASAPGCAPAGWTAWEHHRIRHAIPRAGAELLPEETIPTEAGFVELNAVDFGKGCYVGQETIARTHHRGTLKHHLYRLTFHDSQEAPRVGAEVQLPSGKAAGRVSSVSRIGGESIGLAVLRDADVESGHPLTAEGVSLTVQRPEWMTGG
ncbi:MAG: folate-binding protein YgfZ [Magnetococcales bacterium]|nr:folate-binding protein YgfZ [Magnetococcales bacterium]